MIYTKYGIPVRIISNQPPEDIKAIEPDVPLVMIEAVVSQAWYKMYHTPWRAWRNPSTLRADGGIAEIVAAIEALKQNNDLKEIKNAKVKQTKKSRNKTSSGSNSGVSGV